MLFASQEASEDTLRTARLTTAGPSSTELILHPGVAKITATGAKVTETVARSLERVSLELGGKSQHRLRGRRSRRRRGRRCLWHFGGYRADLYCRVAASRAELDQGQIRGASPGARKVRQNRRSDAAGYEYWSIATPAYKNVLDYIDVVKAEGARCMLGRKPASGAGIKGNQFVETTHFTDVDYSMRIAREEVFGPVFSIISF
jgi:hypothetical protein